MKKFIAIIMVAMFALSMVACSQPAAEETPATEETAAPEASAEAASEYKVAMITDYGDITDQSFNQTTYEACKEYCEAGSLDFKYFKPVGDSTADRVAMIESAIDEGFNIIVMPGYAFAETIKETAELYPDVTFIALDVAQGDLGEDYTVPSNVYCAVYQEELCGYMAGYAAVKLGYTKLGFLGGMAVPAVIRYGYGYVQGADAAAQELGTNIDINYFYGGQFYGDANITSRMEGWYANGTEIVFACGGSMFASVAAAAGGFMGVSSITTFVESTSGAADGGRTGLTSVTTGVLFILAAFFSPIVTIVSSAATCGALVYVGYLMMSEASEIDWSDVSQGFPAFMIVAGVPFTYSISAGIGLGFIAYVIVALFKGEASKIKPLMWIAALAFLVYFFVA